MLLGLHCLAGWNLQHRYGVPQRSFFCQSPKDLYQQQYVLICLLSLWHTCAQQACSKVLQSLSTKASPAHTDTGADSCRDVLIPQPTTTRPNLGPSCRPCSPALENLKLVVQLAEARV